MLYIKVSEYKVTGSQTDPVSLNLQQAECGPLQLLASIRIMRTDTSGSIFRSRKYYSPGQVCTAGLTLLTKASEAPEYILVGEARMKMLLIDVKVNLPKIVTLKF